MLVILTKIAIIFSMAGVGFIANKAKALPDESNGYLISLLMNITAPCMLLTSITGKELTADTFSATIEVLIGTVIFFLIGMAVSYGIVKLLRIDPADQGVYMSILTTVNTGFMGFPVTKAAFGNEALYFMAVSNIILNIYLYSLGLLQINMGSKREFKGLKKTLKPMLNMCSLAAILGIIMLFAGLKLPSFLNELITGIGDITVPLSMIVVGVQLGSSKILSIIRNPKLIGISLINLILWPALTFLAVNWLPLHQMTKLILTYAAAFPTAVIVVALAAKERKNSQLAAEGVALTTLFSMATLPIITMLLSAYYGL
ncbi:AEC family transporter [Anaerovorax odorimutans]|uniref:AEC family transporter n=1 Tax=Anaerovorax odorimutans TaxID=109327 RepID=A0ABT1RJ40_9FIRM|nr:AEC family transporter [Anaerovorax odorimutans]MCQ4635179.1 AEC family transporter [Anaerovorax odorimutans]